MGARSAEEEVKIHPLLPPNLVRTAVMKATKATKIRKAFFVSPSPKSGLTLLSEHSPELAGIRQH